VTVRSEFMIWCRCSRRRSWTFFLLEERLVGHDGDVWAFDRLTAGEEGHVLIMWRWKKKFSVSNGWCGEGVMKRWKQSGL
jgi:hypothetical protein